MADVYIRRVRPPWLTAFLALIVTAVLIVAVVGVVGVVAGWIDVSRDRATQRTTIEIDTGAIRQATKESAESAAESGRAVSEKVGEAMQEVGGRLEREAR